MLNITNKNLTKTKNFLNYFHPYEVILIEIDPKKSPKSPEEIKFKRKIL